MEDPLSKRVLMEVRHQIPAELLGRLGNSDELTALVKAHVASVRQKTLKDIPRSWEPKVIRYVVYLMKQTIAEKYNAESKGWTSLRPFVVELLSDYEEAEVLAVDVMNTILQINQMRRHALYLNQAL